MSSSPLLEMRDIRKSFSGSEVLHGVDLTLNGGEVLALLGENGAGKSTLMKILNGDYCKDAGRILIDGAAADFRSPRDARRAGVQVIYQELNYAPDLSVAENVLLGHLPRRRGVLGLGGLAVDWPEAYRRAGEVLAALNAGVGPRQPMKELSVGKRQVVEIAKALSMSARVLVMDEPTAALTPREVAVLFETVAALRRRGVGVIYISHRLDEVQQVAQRVMVLRDGNVVGVRDSAGLGRRDIVRLMVGRDVSQHERHAPGGGGAVGGPPGEAAGDAAEGRVSEAGTVPTEGATGDNVLEVARFETVNDGRTDNSGAARETVLEVSRLSRPGAFEDVSFAVGAGEVLGLFGLLGAGHVEVTRAIFGAEPAGSGVVRVAGRVSTARSPRQAKRLGIGLVPEDRKTEGLVLGMSVADNLNLAHWPAVSRGGLLSRRSQDRLAGRWVRRLGVRLKAGVRQPVGTLSGGNQQKIVLARWLEAGVRVLLLNEPTRGVDVGARADIYRVLDDLRRRGLALVLVSTDTEEILTMSDRVLVFAKGRVVAEMGRARADRVSLLSAAAGGGAGNDAGASVAGDGAGGGGPGEGAGGMRPRNRNLPATAGDRGDVSSSAGGGGARGDVESGAGDGAGGRGAAPTEERP